MKLFGELRLLATLRRIAKALEEQTQLIRERLILEHPEFAHKLQAEKRKPKPTIFSQPSTQQWNAAYRKRMAEGQERESRDQSRY